MMTKTWKLIFLFILFAVNHSFSQNNWQPVKGKIMTSWAEQINVNKVHDYYPRPQLKRDNWQNLNGLWQYAITDKNQSSIPKVFDGQILVPFAVESALSGVGKTVGKDSLLWYKNLVNITKPKNEKVLLHFGAVDWQCEVYVNGKKVGSHEGGFDPFVFDITSYLNRGAKQEIALRVWDPTNDGPQPIGKQMKNPHAIWYTPVTGIWQTVWIENVPASYITSTKQTPDIDKESLEVAVEIDGAQSGDIITYKVLDGNNVVGEFTNGVNKTFSIPVKNAKLWSPDQPHLYDLQISLKRKGKVIDEVKTYFAMRKISLKKDEKGIPRLALNNEILFQYGPLDQGWWPDGLFTAPSQEALEYDVVKTKDWGFNMIRKHIKVEPAHWYWFCDKEGILVWQDMPSGDMGGNHWDMQPGKIFGGNLDKERTPQSEGYYRKEWKAIMDALINFPSIVVWVPFNEAWGQFKTVEITEWTIKYDPSRLVNSASGGNFFNTGHILDLHNYPDPAMPDPKIFGTGNRALVLGEYGGLGLPVDGHTWQQKDNWGYQSFKNKEELFTRYKKLMTDLKKLIPMGLSAAIYTQTTDVEIETNGIMTYDRKVIKMPEADLKKEHDALYKQ